MKTPDAPQADSAFWKFWEVGTSFHTRLYRLSRGKMGATFQGAPVCLLDHVGAKSGTKRTAPLLCKPSDDRIIVVASKGGVDRHPAWYHNLRANPETEVQYRDERRKVRARVTEGTEREGVWKEMVELYPTYEQYQSRTDRQIPVIVLERR